MKKNHEDYELKELVFEVLKEMKRPKAVSLGLISNEDLCEALQISRWTIKGLRDSGRLPYTKIGSRYFYRIADVNGLVESDFKNSNSLNKLSLRKAKRQSNPQIQSI